MTRDELYLVMEKLRPNCEWDESITDGQYWFVWKDTRYIAPTTEEVATVFTTLALDECHRLRIQAYPSIGDQLDAIWKGGSDMENMRSEVMAVKQRYPKP